MPRLTEYANVAALRSALPTLFAAAADRRRIGLAVSGGADSLALLLLAQHWAASLPQPPELVVYSVDHRLRPEAAAEVAFVVAEAERRGLQARGLRWAGPKPETGVQEAARLARYRLIGEAMRSDGAELLLTAHHRGDQAETVLMRLAHGSGLAGLRGMTALGNVGGIAVLRPLLEVQRSLLREVVAAAGLTPVEDPGNSDRHYERVRWRQALPALAELGLTERRLSEFAARAGAADAALAQWAEQAWAAEVRVDALGAATLSPHVLRELPTAVGTRLLARLLGVVGGHRRAFALEAVENLLAAIARQELSSNRTVLGVSVRQRGQQLWFSREAGRQASAPATIEPGGEVLWDGRFWIGNAGPAALAVRAAHDLTRQGAEQLIGEKILSPASAIRTAPLVTGDAGQMFALGTHRFRPEIHVEFIAVAPQQLSMTAG